MTRSSAQIRSHAQKFLIKLSKKYKSKYSSVNPREQNIFKTLKKKEKKSVLLKSNNSNKNAIDNAEEDEDGTNKLI